MSDPDSFLGTGWSFPPSFFDMGSKVKMQSAEADIEESLKILLSTVPGERLTWPDYGCNLDELVFDSLDTTMKTFLKDKIATAILYYEPRINLCEINFHDEQENEGLILIEIIYEIRGTNSRNNLVFPFYRID